MLKEKIDEFYTSKQRDRDRDYFYITDAGKCPRAVYFQFKKVPKKPMDARVLRVFESGDHTHLRIISSLFALGLVKATEIDIPNKEIVHGRADVIITVDGEPMIVEIKSINSASFARLEAPEPDHYKQLQLYLHFFNLKKGIVLYENKNTQELKEFAVDYDEKTVKECIEKFHILLAQIKSDTIPSVNDVNQWRCSYCPYAEECKKY